MNANYTPENFHKPIKDSVFASYSSFADGKSHIIGAFVKVDGKEVFQEGGAFKIRLNQHMLKSSTFKIQCREDEFDSLSAFPLTNTKHLLGKKIYISFRQFNQTTFHFNGFITEVNRKKKGQDCFLTIKGSSPDALLEDGLMCRSFENQTLEEILQQICQGYPSDFLSLKFNPKYKDRIPYSTLYQETKYQYIQRLAKLYGELLYWNGESLVFGGYGGKTVRLLDSEDMENFRIKLKTNPQNFSYKAYHSGQGGILQSDTGQLQKKRIINHFQEYVLEASGEIYPARSESYYNHSLLQAGSKELSEAVQRQKQFRENVLFVKSRTYNPNLNIGDIAKIEEWNSQSELFKNGINPMERYLITDIEHNYESGEGYNNEFKGIPHEQFIPPYYDEKAYPKGEKQRAVISDNNDLKGIGRVRVRFDWMQPHEQTPWLRIVFPHAGAGKGFYFIPEIGEEVMMDFESDNMDKPFVQGTLYNGNEKSGYYDSRNQLKALHTKEGHIIQFDEREESIGITIKDKNNNYIHLNTKENNLDIEALETIHIKAKNMEIDIQENLTTKIGKNIKTTAGQEISQYSGNKTILHSGQNMEVEAMNHLDLYGKQKLITYTKGNAELGALGRMHVHGTQALYSAKSTLDYKAPNMGRLAQPNDFLYGKEKQIVSAQWMDIEMTQGIDEAKSGEKVKLLIHTRNYDEGEEISLTVAEKEDKDISENIKRVTLAGIVKSDGSAILQEPLDIGYYTEPPKEKTKEEIQREREAKEKQEKWKQWEEKQWEKYQAKKRNKGFLNF